MKRIEFKSGASRFVICVGKYAFKFPLAYPGQRFTRRLCNGILGNLTEKEFSSFEFKFSDFTLTCCPVVFSLPFGLLNVMYRVDPIGEDIFNKILETPSFPDAIEKKKKKDSFGILNGHLVAVDFA